MCGRLRVGGRERVGQRLGVGAGAQRVVGADRCLNSSVTASLETGPDQVFSVRRRPPTPPHRWRTRCAPLTCSGSGSTNVPLTRWPVPTVAGSATLSSASPAVEVTVAVVDAKYVPRDARRERAERGRRAERRATASPGPSRRPCRRPSPRRSAVTLLFR